MVAKPKLTTQKFCPNDNWVLKETLIADEGQRTSVLLGCWHPDCDYQAVIHFDHPLTDSVGNLVEQLGKTFE